MIDLKRFSNIPFTQFQDRKINHAIQEYLDSYNVKLNVIYNISDSETQIHTRQHLCGAVPMLAAAIWNQTCKPEDELYMFRSGTWTGELKISGQYQIHCIRCMGCPYLTGELPRCRFWWSGRIEKEYTVKSLESEMLLIKASRFRAFHYGRFALRFHIGITKILCKGTKMSENVQN